MSVEESRLIEQGFFLGLALASVFFTFIIIFFVPTLPEDGEKEDSGDNYE